jgi:glutathione peroxidase-family protein
MPLSLIFSSIAQSAVGGQEPGTHEEILEFVKKFDPKMPEKLVFFEKADVNGANAREVFSFLKRELPGDEGSNDIRWNFGKEGAAQTCHVAFTLSDYGSTNSPPYLFVFFSLQLESSW